MAKNLEAGDRIFEYIERLQKAKDLEDAGYTVSPHFKGWVVIGHVHFTRNQKDAYSLDSKSLDDAISRWFDREEAEGKKHMTPMCCGNLCQKRKDTFMVMINIHTEELQVVRLNSAACRLYYQDVYNWWVFIKMPGTHDSDAGEGMWTWWNRKMDKLC